MLGGAFDPPHVGHLVLAQEAWWQLRLDELRLVPAGIAPHKPEGAWLDGELRARLLEAAVAGHPGLRVWREEIARSGPSYTADTLDALAREAPGAGRWLVLGADQLAGLPGWHEPERILAAARLGAAARAGERAAAPPGARVDVIRIPRIDISSTLIRARIADGRPIRYLVPEGVERLLQDAGLVASPTGP